MLGLERSDVCNGAFSTKEAVDSEERKDKINSERTPGDANCGNTFSYFGIERGTLIIVGFQMRSRTSKKKERTSAHSSIIGLLGFVLSGRRADRNSRSGTLSRH